MLARKERWVVTGAVAGVVGLALNCIAADLTGYPMTPKDLAAMPINSLFALVSLACVGAMCWMFKKYIETVGKQAIALSRLADELNKRPCVMKQGGGGLEGVNEGSV